MSYPLPYGYTTQLLTPPVRRTSTAHLVIAWISALVTLLYLLPWAIAATRNKRNVGAIALINLFLGWSAVGWIAALVMACLNDDRHNTVVLLAQPVQPYPSQPYPDYAGWTSSGLGRPALNPSRSAQADGPTAGTSWPSSQATATYPVRTADEPTQVLPDPNRQFRP